MGEPNATIPLWGDRSAVGWLYKAKSHTTSWLDPLPCCLDLLQCTWLDPLPCCLDLLQCFWLEPLPWFLDLLQ